MKNSILNISLFYLSKLWRWILLESNRQSSVIYTFPFFPDSFSLWVGRRTGDFPLRNSTSSVKIIWLRYLGPLEIVGKACTLAAVLCMNNKLTNFQDLILTILTEYARIWSHEALYFVLNTVKGNWKALLTMLYKSRFGKIWNAKLPLKDAHDPLPPESFTFCLSTILMTLNRKVLNSRAYTW